MLRSKFLKALKWKTKNKRSYEKSEPKTQIPQAQNRRWNFNSRPVTRKPKGPKPENSRYYYSWWFVSAGSTKLNVPRELNFFFLDLRKSYLSKNIFYRSRWGSKTLSVPDSYKKCTSWLELETCYANLKPFIITLRLLGTLWT